MRQGLTKLAFCLSCLGFTAMAPNALANYNPRIYAWGMGGGAAIGRVDALMPMFIQPSRSVFYSDLQAEVSSKEAWYAGLGLGYRTLTNPGILGGYLFLDRDVSNDKNAFYVLNPGAELFHRSGVDLRVNGYIPVSNRQKNGRSFFLGDIADTCGVNQNTNLSVFAGHQQFQHQFHNMEEVGPGVDAEVGVHFLRAHDLSVYGGGYYFKLEHQSDVKGFETRAVLPIKPSVALTMEASYDGQQKTAIVGGLRVQLGHVPHLPATLPDRLYDPITRNLASVKSGTGIPIIKSHVDDGLALFRDNIFFFTGTGAGVAFSGASTGTFENPLSKNQFTQTTVDGIAAIAPNANLFFNTGTYVINAGQPGAPNANIDLPGGQSIYGRTVDYRNSAVGIQRPELLGTLSLLAGNNTVDSIILTNSMSGTSASPLGAVDFVVMDIQNAPNVIICNDIINGIVTLDGDNVNPIFTSGIFASNSQVMMHASTVNVQTTVSGTNANQILLTGIGGNNVISELTIFNIDQSLINAAANISTNGATGVIATAGIGGNATLGGNAPFFQNTFSITNSDISSSAISSSNLGTTLITGIGGNALNGGTATFDDDIFTLSVSINSTHISGTSSNPVLMTGIGGNATGAGAMSEFLGGSYTIANSKISSSNNLVNNDSFSFVTGIGGNEALTSNASFLDTTWNVNTTAISSLSNIANENLSFNYVAGIGGNSLGNNTNSDFSFFQGNTISLLNSQVSGTASALVNIGAENFATGLGGNAIGSDSSFRSNTLNVSNSEISGLAQLLEGNVGGSNFATGIGGNANAAGGIASFGALDAGNTLNVTGSSISGSATAGGNNGNNFATGIGGNAVSSAQSRFDSETGVLTNNTISATATVSGNGSANASNASTVLGGNASDTGDASFIDGNNFMITGGSLASTAQINGFNQAGNNVATGTGGNSFAGGFAVTEDTIINIFDNTITVLAQVTEPNSGSNLAIGFRADNDTVVTVTDSTGTITASAVGLNNALLSVVTGGSVTLFDSNIVVSP